MPKQRGGRLRIVLLGFVCLLSGLVAGRLSSDWPNGSAIFFAAAIFVTGSATIWFVRRWSDSIERLSHSVMEWDSQASSPVPDLYDQDELTPLRMALETTRQKLLDASRAHEEQLQLMARDTALVQTVLGTMIEGVLVMDDSSRLIYANPAALRLLELDERDHAGRFLQEIVRSASLQEVVMCVLEKRVPQHVELELPRKRRTVMVSAGPLPVNPQPGVVLVFHDVSELRRLERLRRDFVTNVSHELKTPLTSIQAYADTLMDGAIDDSEHNRKFLARIVEQAERLRMLIMDLIGLARIESSHQALELSEIDLGKVIRQCVETHSALAQAKGVSLQSDIAEGVSPILAEPEGMQTILNNLVRNGLAYTPKSGRVEIRLFQREDSVMLEVADTGIGIPQEHQPRIFERFYRVDKARSREVGGTGLGLAITRHLVEQYGGEINVESEPDQGSCFQVCFPVPHQKAPSDAGEESTSRKFMKN